MALAAAWLVFAPGAFGGQTTYVMVAGASMEPALHQGDLVLTRRGTAYQVGQIVAYRHPQVGPVIHRIIRTDGMRYVLQGDNNSWIDSFEPSPSEVVGASWIVVPHGGSLLAMLRTPGGLALLSLLFGAILVTTVVTKTVASPKSPETNAVSRKTSPDGLFFAVAVLALGSLLLGIAAFTQPTTSLTPREIPYQQSGTFSYHAAAPATVYGGGSVTTGDPVYDALVPAFYVGFDYRLSSVEPVHANGTVALELEVSEPNGWHRRLLLQPETAFKGDRVSAGGRVDLRTVRRVISLLEDATAVDRDAYWVDVIADINLEGEVDGHTFQASFLPRLPFALDDHELYLRAGDTLDAADSDLTRPMADGSVSYMEAEPATLTILGLRIPVSAAREAAVVGLLMAVAAGAALGLPAYRARRAGRATRILSEYPAVLVSVREPLHAPKSGFVEVRDFDDLAHLAERTGKTILHAAVVSEHHFYLRDGEALYHVVVIDDPAALEG